MSKTGVSPPIFINRVSTTTFVYGVMLKRFNVRHETPHDIIMKCFMDFLTFRKHTEQVELIFLVMYAVSRTDTVSTEALTALMNNAQEEREPEPK